MAVGVEPSGWMAWPAWTRCACGRLTGEEDGQDADDAVDEVLLDEPFGRSTIRQLTQRMSATIMSSLNLQSSTGMSRQVSPEDVAEEHLKLQDCIQKLRNMPKFIAAIRRFQRSIAERALREGPNELELDRGVHIEHVYDFYDPAVKKIRLRKMDAHLVHRRAHAESRAQRRLMTAHTAEEGHTPPEVCTSPTGSMMSFASENSELVPDEFVPDDYATTAEDDSRLISPPSEDESPSAAAAAANVRRKSSLRPGKEKQPFCSQGSSQEVIANWGVIAGKLVLRCVIDVRSVTQISKKEKPVKVLRSVRECALQVIRQVEKLTKKVGMAHVDEFDSAWSEGELLEKLFGKEAFTDTLMLIAKAAGNIVASQPIMVSTDAPCRVFGDIHGQLRDLLLLFHAFGNGLLSSKSEMKMKLVFNGDFVDRGAHQLAVVGILFALKVAFPNDVFLVRGNHEEKAMNEKYGFHKECMDHMGKSWGKKVFQLVQGTFNNLPLACLIGRRVLCVHGGIGDGKWSLQDLLQVRRPLNEERLNADENRWIYGLLWSDPIEDSKNGKDGSHGVFGVHPSPRGKLATKFGWNVTKTFCARNGLSLIIRSHQSKQNGVGFEVMHENLLMRVFSARDYEGHGNDGGVLLIKNAATSKDAKHLSVRAQVLRSATKAQREDARRKKSEAPPAAATRRKLTTENLKRP